MVSALDDQLFHLQIFALQVLEISIHHQLFGLLDLEPMRYHLFLLFLDTPLFHSFPHNTSYRVGFLVSIFRFSAYKNVEMGTVPNFTSSVALQLLQLFLA